MKQTAILTFILALAILGFVSNVSGLSVMNVTRTLTWPAGTMTSTATITYANFTGGAHFDTTTITYTSTSSLSSTFTFSNVSESQTEHVNVTQTGTVIHYSTSNVTTTHVITNVTISQSTHINVSNITATSFIVTTSNSTHVDVTTSTSTSNTTEVQLYLVANWTIWDTLIIAAVFASIAVVVIIVLAIKRKSANM
jgi:hypothetical protein